MKERQNGLIQNAWSRQRADKLHVLEGIQEQHGSCHKTKGKIVLSNLKLLDITLTPFNDLSIFKINTLAPEM